MKPLYARNIHYLRNQQRLTIKEAAELASVNSSTWASWEDGRAFPRHDKLPRVLRTLKYFDVIRILENDIAGGGPGVDQEWRAMHALQAIKSIVSQNY